MKKYSIIFSELNKRQQKMIYNYNAYIYEHKIYSSKEYLEKLFKHSRINEVDKQEVKKYIQERRINQ